LNVFNVIITAPIIVFTSLHFYYR